MATEVQMQKYEEARALIFDGYNRASELLADVESPMFHTHNLNAGKDTIFATLEAIIRAVK